MQAVYKSQGLRKGQKVEKLCVIRIVDVRLEPLSKISQEEVIREGFPDMTPADFIAFFGASHKGGDGNVTRIEFEYLEEE